MMDRFNCPYCGDAMHAKFTRTHLMLCLLAELQMQTTMDELMSDIADATS